MARKVVVIKTKTANGRSAHTQIFLPERDMVVINQRVIATHEDINTGWFPNYTSIIRKTQNYIVVENETVYWTTSFDAIIAAYKHLTNKNTRI